MDVFHSQLLKVKKSIEFIKGTGVVTHHQKVYFLATLSYRLGIMPPLDRKMFCQGQNGEFVVSGLVEATVGGNGTSTVGILFLKDEVRGRWGWFESGNFEI